MSTQRKMFEDIVFLQGHEAETALNILTEKGEEAVIQYLSQWHYPGEHMITDFLPHTENNAFVQGIYVLSYNLSLGYIGLVAKIET